MSEFEEQGRFMEQDGFNEQEVYREIVKYPCLKREPYAFISYSSQDKERVWQDALGFMQSGYNIWIDHNRNIKPTDKYWDEVVMPGIHDEKCRLFLFYVSENSMKSEACLMELEEWTKRNEEKNCKEPCPLILIEVKPIKNVWTFRSRIHQEIGEDINLTDEKKQDLIQRMTELMGKHFLRNDRNRIFSKEDRRKKPIKYENEITGVFKQKDYRIYHRSPVEMRDIEHRSKLRQSMEFLDDGKPAETEECLKECADDDYLAATLLLYFLYATGPAEVRNPDKARDMKCLAMMQRARADIESWEQKAEAESEKGNDLEAAVIYAACSYDCNHLDGAKAEDFLDKAQKELKAAKKADEGYNLYYSLNDLLSTTKEWSTGEKSTANADSQFDKSREEVQRLCFYGGCFIWDSSALLAPEFALFLENHFEVLQRLKPAEQEKHQMLIPAFAEAKLKGTRGMAVKKALDEGYFGRLPEVKSYDDLIKYFYDNNLSRKVNFIYCGENGKGELKDAKTAFLNSEYYTANEKGSTSIFYFMFHLMKNGALIRG